MKEAALPIAQTKRALYNGGLSRFWHRMAGPSHPSSTNRSANEGRPAIFHPRERAMLNWLFRPVIELLERIIMNQAELAQALADLKTQADKAKAEIVAAVAALEDAIKNNPVAPEVETAFADLKGSVQGLDDLNKDATPTP